MGWLILLKCNGMTHGGNCWVFQGMTKQIFCMGGQQWWNFILPNPKLREEHFSDENLTVKFRISKSRGLVPPSDAHVFDAVVELQIYK